MNRLIWINFCSQSEKPKTHNSFNYWSIVIFHELKQKRWWWWCCRQTV